MSILEMENNNLNFVYENRQIKKGDALTLISGIKKGDMFGEFHVGAIEKNYLSRLPTMFYVASMSSDSTYCEVQPKKGVKSQKIKLLSLPVELFKIVKVPKMQDVVMWLYDNQLVEYPTKWDFFKNEMNSISRFIIKIFQNNLRAIYLVNKTCNHLYNNHPPLEILMYYKTIIQQLGLQYHDRYAAYNKINSKKSFIDTCLNIDSLWHTLDAISIWEMNNKNVFDGQYLSCADRIAFHKDPKKRFKHDNEKKNFEELKSIIEAGEKKTEQYRVSSDDRYIKILNQQVVDELELTIFNVKTLPSRNQILFIFIDKDNNKRFYLQDFNFVFYVSKGKRIIDNDYIVSYDELEHIPFAIQNFEVLRNLKFAVNDSYKRFMKKGGF